MKTFKTRHQFYLPDSLSEKLDALSAVPGSSKTSILTDALTSWLDRRAGDELDRRFGKRLDRMTRAQERLDHKLEFVAEVLGTFIQHQLTLVAHQPPFEPETAQLGGQRYRRFMETVGRRLAQPDRSPVRVEMARLKEKRDG